MRSSSKQSYSCSKVSSSMRFLLFGRGSFSVELGVAPESCLGDGVASTDVAAVVMESPGPTGYIGFKGLRCKLGFIVIGC